MKKILINGLNAKTGGGKSILNNYLKILTERDSINYYYILTPKREEYEKYERKNIIIIDIKKKYKKTIYLPYTFAFVLPKLLKNLKINSIFNLADIPIRTNKFQVFLFDWPYAVYPESTVWKNMSLNDFIARKLKLFFFKKNLKFVNSMIAQNKAIKNRLIKLYNLDDIEVVNNAVSLENLENKKKGEKDFKLPKDEINLLYLTHYYPHKNLEIFISVAKKIQKNNLKFNLIITIENNHGKRARNFLKLIKNESLDNIIINVGSVDMKDVPGLYKQCSALLMPTLLESFSGTYVEAMYHKKPILTSSFDFAKSVCGDAAIYFNPLDDNDILNNIKNLFSDDENKNLIIKKGDERLKSFSTWEEAYVKYQKIILYNEERV